MYLNIDAKTLHSLLDCTLSLKLPTVVSGETNVSSVLKLGIAAVIMYWQY